ncbi:MAG TPA: ABC transporter ATP-binding protein [Acidimicrobiales bacterium]|nr:ABC transporter ATP-binding protein [Acidimicrobiales bacterium]
MRADSPTTQAPEAPAATTGRPSAAGPGDGGDALVRATGLRKRFGRQVAVDGVDFTVRRGEVFGFLGPNGAGKTTTMRMIACVSPRTGGDLSVLGLDPAHDGPSIRARIGVVPQDDNLDTELTVWDNLLIYGRYFGLPVPVIRERAAELLAFARLDDRRDSRVDPLSGGMKRRLTIARALINRPEMLLLDEPTTGLDPQARHMLWERLYRLKREGVTLVLTTHYMDEAEQLCDRLVIMDEGRIAAAGSPRELIARHCTREVVELRFATPELQDAALPAIDALGDRVEPVADRVLVYTAHGDDTAGRLAAVHVHPDSVLVRRSSLEDVFLRLTGRSLDE